jgi:uncharacterized protein YuzE
MTDRDNVRRSANQVEDAPVIYDDENDVLYVTLSGNDVARTVAFGDLRLVDYDAKGSPVAIEFIGASDGLDLSEVPSEGRIKTLLAKAGINFPIVT